MREIARIIRIDGTRATVKGGEFSGCFGCMNQECRENGNLFEAENRAGLELHDGSLVEVDVNNASAALQALVVLGVPIVAFILCYVAAFILWPFSEEGLHAGLGLLGLTVASAAIYWFRRRRPERALPFILRVVSESEIEANAAMGGAAEPDGQGMQEP